MSEIVQPLRFYGVLCIARSVSLGRHAQLTRCFSAVAELLVVCITDATAADFGDFNNIGLRTLLYQWRRHIFNGGGQGRGQPVTPLGADDFL